MFFFKLFHRFLYIFTIYYKFKYKRMTHFMIFMSTDKPTRHTDGRTNKYTDIEWARNGNGLNPTEKWLCEYKLIFLVFFALHIQPDMHAKQNRISNMIAPDKDHTASEWEYGMAVKKAKLKMNSNFRLTSINMIHFENELNWWQRLGNGNDWKKGKYNLMGRISHKQLFPQKNR